MDRNNIIPPVRIGLLIAIATLAFGVGMGIVFGIFEDAIKDWINAGIAAHPSLHDQASSGKIWRYVQRAHFHAAGIGAFTLILIIITALTDMKDQLKKLTAILISLAGLYPFSWFNMFLLGPELGRSAAHHALSTELFVMIGVGGFLAGLALLVLNLLTGNKQTH